MENIIKGFLLEEGCAGCGEGDSRRLKNVTCHCIPEDIPWFCGRKTGSVSQACSCFSSSPCSRLYSVQERVCKWLQSQCWAILHLHLHGIVAGDDGALSSHSYSHWKKRSPTTHLSVLPQKLYTGCIYKARLIHIDFCGWLGDQGFKQEHVKPRIFSGNTGWCLKPWYDFFLQFCGYLPLQKLFS